MAKTILTPEQQVEVERYSQLLSPNRSTRSGTFR